MIIDKGEVKNIIYWTEQPFRLQNTHTLLFHQTIIYLLYNLTVTKN